VKHLHSAEGTRGLRGGGLHSKQACRRRGCYWEEQQAGVGGVERRAAGREDLAGCAGEGRAPSRPAAGAAATGRAAVRAAGREDLATCERFCGRRKERPVGR